MITLKLSIYQSSPFPQDKSGSGAMLELLFFVYSWLILHTSGFTFLDSSSLLIMIGAAS